MELLPRLHHLAVRFANLYLCEDDDGLTLIDCGLPWTTDTVLRYLSRLRYRQEDLVRILITHADLDHVGSLAQLQAFTGATVLASAETHRYLRAGRAPRHGTGRFAALLARLGYRPLTTDRVETVTDGENLPILGNLRVLATPGHTPDHLSFFSEDRGVLFAGDALFNIGRPRLGPRFITADPAAARVSALRLLRLTPAVLACGHGRPLTGHGDAPLMRLYQELSATP